MLSRVVIATYYESANEIVQHVRQYLEKCQCDVILRDLPSLHCFGEDPHTLDIPVDAVIIVGGDGSMLSGAELVYGSNIPLLGINTGHVGFLTQCEAQNVERALENLVEGRYTIQERRTETIKLYRPHQAELCGWALNEVTIEKDQRASMIELCVGTEDTLIESFGADGMIIATSTGSTAYAFSANGPILFPSVEALELVPLAAHTLFSRSLIGDRDTTFRLQLLEGSPCSAWVTCDGRRSIHIERNSVMSVSLSDIKIPFIKFEDSTFAQRLVNKFNLPTMGWRHRSPHMSSSYCE